MEKIFECLPNKVFLFGRRNLFFKTTTLERYNTNKSKINGTNGVKNITKFSKLHFFFRFQHTVTHQIIAPSSILIAMNGLFPLTNKNIWQSKLSPQLETRYLFVEN